MFTIQYLEPGPHIVKISPVDVRAKLKAALNIIPVDGLLLGWDIPDPLVEICREETTHKNVKLFRWHPLLCSDGSFITGKAWRTRNYRGVPQSGFRDLPEFTFICPNHPDAREAILSHLQSVAESGYFDGIFLDRMRFPSPSENLVESLTCFCRNCRLAALDFGIDLVEVQAILSKTRKAEILKSLLDIGSFHENTPLNNFWDFRKQVMTSFVRDAVDVIRKPGLEIGLDCFSPSLTRMVGQNLVSLTSLADWTKTMVYGHAWGPATLPFELTHLADWLLQDGSVQENKAFGLLAQCLGFSLPSNRNTIRSQGICSETLASEFRRGREETSGKLLAGIELVEMPGVSELSPQQIEADVRAFRDAGADGLAISWDLWHIPLERLELVLKIWS